MALRLITAPAVEVVSLSTAKAYLYETPSADDTLIGIMLGASRARYDGGRGILGRALITQTWEYSADAFPSADVNGGWLELPLGPVQSITSVGYTDGAGSAATIAGGEYLTNLPGDPTRISPAIGGSWPASGAAPGAVVVRFVAGYGDDPEDVPAGLVQAILLNVAHWYENRDAMGREFPGDGLALGFRLSWPV